MGLSTGRNIPVRNKSDSLRASTLSFLHVSSAFLEITHERATL
jgi:hypothetical protein